MKAVWMGVFLMMASVGSSQSLVGSWQNQNGNATVICIFTERFFSVSTYRLSDKTFEGTYGGSYQLEDGQLIEKIEFDTWAPERVGTVQKTKLTVTTNQIKKWSEKGEQPFTRLDNGGPGQLSGAWLITGRIQGNELQKITPGARRTMKIMSGTRFQWIAYNVDTKEFFGTGGGTYLTEKGKYTENIEFFSRDNSRVGMSLSFDFALENGDWRHKGKSSKGDPIDEVWTQRVKLGM